MLGGSQQHKNHNKMINDYKTKHVKNTENLVPTYVVPYASASGKKSQIFKVLWKARRVEVC